MTDQPTKYYSVWLSTSNRWTNGSCEGHGVQNPQNPFKLSKEEAERWCKYMGKDFEVREIATDGVSSIDPKAAPKCYSVWNISQSRWTDARWNARQIEQDRNKPFRLSLEEAKEYMADFAKITSSNYEIREVLPDNSSAPVENGTMSEAFDAPKYYSLWFQPANRWTDGSYLGKQQDPSKPLRLSRQEAEAWHDNYGNDPEWEIREVSTTNQSKPIPYKIPNSSTYEVFDLGEKVGVHITADNTSYYASSTSYSVPATIIGRTKEMTILGWKTGDLVPSFARPRTPSSKETTYIDNHSDYQWSLIVKSTDACTVVKDQVMSNQLHIGDRIELYIDRYNNIVSFPTNRTITGTLVCEHSSNRIIGWTAKEAASDNATTARPKIDGMSVENFSDYTRFFKLDGSHAVKLIEPIVENDELVGLRKRCSELENKVNVLTQEKKDALADVKPLMKEAPLSPAERIPRHGDHILYSYSKGTIKGRVLVCGDVWYCIVSPQEKLFGSCSLEKMGFKPEQQKAVIAAAKEFGLDLLPYTENLSISRGALAYTSTSQVSLDPEFHDENGELKVQPVKPKSIYKHGDCIIYKGHRGRIIRLPGETWCIVLDTEPLFTVSPDYVSGMASARKKAFDDAVIEFGLVIRHDTANVSALYCTLSPEYVFGDDLKLAPRPNEVPHEKEAKQEPKVEIKEEVAKEEPKENSGMATAAMIVGAAAGALLTATMSPKNSISNVRVEEVGSLIDAEVVSEALEATI